MVLLTHRNPSATLPAGQASALINASHPRYRLTTRQQ